jgi:hypothetical protein
VQEITVDGDVVFSAAPDLVQPDLVHLTFDNEDLTNTAGPATFSTFEGSANFTFDNDVGGFVLQSVGNFAAKTTDLTGEIGGSNSFTWAFWYNRTQDNGGERIFGPFSNTSGNPGGFIFFDSSSNQNTPNVIWRKNKNTEGEFQTVNNFNAWNHLVLTYDASTNTAVGYSNGQEDFTNNISVGSLDSAGLSLSACGDNNFADYEGFLEDVRIYSTALTSQQVFDIFDNTGPNS